MVSVEDVMPRLDSVDFRALLPPEVMGFSLQVAVNSDLSTQYIQTHWRDDYLNLWLDMRQLIATQGFVRAAYRQDPIEKLSGVPRKFINLPDGFTYWVSPALFSDNWDKAFDPDGNYSLYRKRYLPIQIPSEFLAFDPDRPWGDETEWWDE